MGIAGKSVQVQKPSLTREEKVNQKLSPTTPTPPLAHRKRMISRFAIAMPIADRRQKSLANSKIRQSNDALQFKGAMENR